MSAKFQKRILSILHHIENTENIVETKQIQLSEVAHYKLPHLHLPYIVYKFSFGALSVNVIVDQGPVVQSIVSLTSSLRGQLVKCFKTL